MSQLTLAEAAAPATPSTGKVTVYAKADGLVYAKDDAGTEKILSGLTLGTEQVSTSGTSIDFTSIPAWVQKITIEFVGVSTNGTADMLIQIGDSGGIETTGYGGANVLIT